MEVGPSGLEMRRDQHLGDMPARRLACVATGIRCSEVSAPATPSAAELIPNAEAVNQIVGALGGSPVACLIDGSGATIQHGRNVGRTEAICARWDTSGSLIRVCMGSF